MSKGLKIFLIILGIIILLLILGIFFALIGSASPIATLNIEKGSVDVKTGENWGPAKDGMSLNVKDSVKTGGDGKATIILYESIIIQMNPNTEISIEQLTKQNITISQNSGSTWSKFMNVAGINTYSVETPTTVATVRGTGFFVNVSDDGNSSDVFVGEGVVDIQDENGVTQKIEQFKRLIKEKGKEAIFKEITPKQKALMLSFVNQDVNIMRNIRERQIKRNFIAMAVLKTAYNLDKDKLPLYLKKMDYGVIDAQEVIRRSPIKGQFLDKMAQISDKIIEHKKLMNDLLENAKNDSEFNSLIDPSIRFALDKELQEVMKPDDVISEAGNISNENLSINSSQPEKLSGTDWCKAGMRWNYAGATTDGAQGASWVIKGIEQFKGGSYCHVTLDTVQNAEQTTIEYYYKETNGEMVDMWMILKDSKGTISEIHSITPTR